MLRGMLRACAKHAHALPLPGTMMGVPITDITGLRCASRKAGLLQVHLAWIRTPRSKGGLGHMDIPILADVTKVSARSSACQRPAQAPCARPCPAPPLRMADFMPTSKHAERQHSRRERALPRRSWQRGMACF